MMHDMQNNDVLDILYTKRNKQTMTWLALNIPSGVATVRDRAPGPFYEMLGQTHVNGWSRVVASQNGGSTSYIFPLRLGVLQWSRHLFNYLDK